MQSLELEMVPLDDSPESLQNDRAQLVALLRKGQGAARANLLLDATIDWIASLPRDVRPLELARQDPRTANGIAEVWQRVARCAEYLDSLVSEPRGERKTFPREVARELTMLKSYYAELHRRNGAAWGATSRGQ